MKLSRLGSAPVVGLRAATLAACLVAPALAMDQAQDDLLVVRKAVLARAEAQATAAPARTRPPAEAPLEGPAVRSERRSGPMWFRVRIEGKPSRGGRVFVDLPLGLVRGAGEDGSVPSWRCEGRKRSCPALGQLLRTLDGGQSLVEIQNDGVKLRVWID